MPKFSALSFADLQSPERAAGRLARKAEIVVEVEASDGSWCELDADTEEHARVLANNWVSKLGARGCSCWHVRQIDGKLAPTTFYKKFWESEHAD